MKSLIAAGGLLVMSVLLWASDFTQMAYLALVAAVAIQLFDGVRRIPPG